MFDYVSDSHAPNEILKIRLIKNFDSLEEMSMNEKAKEKASQLKRTRASFTHIQLEELERMFSNQRYRNNNSDYDIRCYQK